MKRCGKCHQILPLSEFWFRKKDGYYQSWCKNCSKNKSKESYKKNHKPQKRITAKEKNALFILGGYKIYILNYVSSKEFKYNIISTKGKFFKTNLSNQFIDKIREIIYE